MPYINTVRGKTEVSFPWDPQV